MYYEQDEWAFSALFFGPIDTRGKLLSPCSRQEKWISEKLKSHSSLSFENIDGGRHQKIGAKLIKSAQQKHRNVINNDGGFFSVKFATKL